MFVYNNSNTSKRVHSTTSNVKANKQSKSRKRKKIGSGNKKKKLTKKNKQFLRSLGFKLKKKN